MADFKLISEVWEKGRPCGYIYNDTYSIVLLYPGQGRIQEFSLRDAMGDFEKGKIVLKKGQGKFSYRLSV